MSASTDRAAFEQFVHEWTGRDMADHRRAQTWGLDADSFAWACWQRATEIERGKIDSGLRGGYDEACHVSRDG